MGERQHGKPGFMLCLSYHLPNISGLTLSAHQIGRYLVSRGHKVTVVTSHMPPDAAPRETIDGVDIVRSPVLFRIGKAPFMPRYWLDLWRNMDDVAVVNVHLPNPDAATVAIVAKLRGRKLIVSHISSMSTATLADRVMRAVAAIPHVIAGLLADRVQVVSEDYAEASTFCRLFRGKLRPAPLPVWLSLFPGETHPPRQPRKASAERPYRIGYVGRIARQKSLGLLLDALPDIVARAGGPVVLDLLGPAKDVIGESDWQEILANAEASGGAIRYGGVLTGRALADFYGELDLLVLPSTDRLESFGLVQVEAMLRGVPVVASDLPGMRVPVARTGMGKLFPAGDTVAMAEAIGDVLRNGPPASLTPAELDALFGDEVACAPYVEMLAKA